MRTLLVDLVTLTVWSALLIAWAVGGVWLIAWLVSR